MSSITSCRIHQIALKPLQEKFGEIPEKSLIDKMMEDLNFGETYQFKPFGTRYKMRDFETVGNAKTKFGFEMYAWYQKEWIKNKVMDTLACTEFDLRNNVIQFHTKTGLIFAITYGPYWTCLEPFIRKKFSEEILPIANTSDENWKTVPLTSPIYELKAFSLAYEYEIKLLIENEYVQFNLDDDFDTYDIPEVLDFFVQNTKLRSNLERKV